MQGLQDRVTQLEESLVLEQGANTELQEQLAAATA